MYNLIHPKVYEALLDRSRQDPIIAAMLQNWDTQGGRLVDFLAASAIALSEQNEALAKQVVDILSRSPNCGVVLKGKLK